MQSSRDSSVLRSLAIAFGDGLAFGVGMKITQQAGRSQVSPVPALAEPPLADRLDEIERRVQKVEKLPTAITVGGPGQPFDQKVLEAVVGALDARLAEQTTQTERRLRDLEAKLTIELKTLHQQDHSVSTGLQNRMVELHEQFSGQVGEIRKRSDEAQAAYRTELAALHRQFALETAKAVEGGLTAKEAQFQHKVDGLHAAVEEHTRTTLARHQILEAGLTAQSAGLGSRIENLRSGIAMEASRAVEEALAQHRVATGEQIGQLRAALDDQAQAAAAQTAALSQRLDELRGAAASDTAHLIEEALGRNHAEIADLLADLHGEVDEHARAALTREAATAANWESRLANLHAEFTATAAHLVNERVAQAIEEQVLPLRAELDAKDRELQQLRQKLADSDRNAANMMLAIGQACRDAAERISPSVAAEFKPEAIEMQPPVPEAPVVAAGSDEGLPGFVQAKPPGKLLRIPLVSSMAMAIAAGAFFLHYL